MKICSSAAPLFAAGEGPRRPPRAAAASPGRSAGPWGSRTRGKRRPAGPGVPFAAPRRRPSPPAPISRPKFCRRPSADAGRQGGRGARRRRPRDRPVREARRRRSSQAVRPSVGPGVRASAGAIGRRLEEGRPVAAVLRRWLFQRVSAASVLFGPPPAPAARKLNGGGRFPDRPSKITAPR